MARHELDTKELAARLSHRPRYLLNSTIAIDDSSPVLPVSIQARPEDNRPSSLGVLDRLPLEILHQMFNQLEAS